MNLFGYNLIVVFLAIVPAFAMTAIIFCFDDSKKREFVLLTMNGIVTRRSIDDGSGKQKVFLFHGRVIDTRLKTLKFILLSVMLANITVTAVILIATLRITYECHDEENLDCFKRRFGSEAFKHPSYDERPVNCSEISSEDLVFCYEIVSLQPEYWIIAFAAGYLLMRVMRVCVLVVSKGMLWVAGKQNDLWLKRVKYAATIIFSVVVILVLILSITSQKFEHASRKLSWVEILQITSVFCLPLVCIWVIPWKELAQQPEYLDYASRSPA